MSIGKLKIKIPKGQTLDLENSDIEKGIVVYKDKGEEPSYTKLKIGVDTIPTGIYLMLNNNTIVPIQEAISCKILDERAKKRRLFYKAEVSKNDCILTLYYNTPFSTDTIAKPSQIKKDERVASLPLLLSFFRQLDQRTATLLLKNRYILGTLSTRHRTIVAKYYTWRMPEFGAPICFAFNDVWGDPRSSNCVLCCITHKK